MWELDYKESWAWKNWCFWTVVLEKTLESPLDSKEIQLVHPKGNQSWIFIGRTDAEAEAPILWPPDAKKWHIWKDPDAGKDWRWKEKGTTVKKLSPSSSSRNEIYITIWHSLWVLQKLSTPTPRWRMEGWCWPSWLQSTKAWTVSTFALTLREILRCSSPFVNMHVP